MSKLLNSMTLSVNKYNNNKVRIGGISLFLTIYPYVSCYENTTAVVDK